jgi:hypothetical protein
MVWTEITRPKYRRDGLRYASDTTDDEWAVIAPYVPSPRRRGRSRTTALRAVHLLTDTAGIRIAGIVHEASIQNRDVAPTLPGLIEAPSPSYVTSSPMATMPATS